jgi:hypothetical protein
MGPWSIPRHIAARQLALMAKFQIGDIVTVKGYGGHAEIIGMEVDGVTPHGYPKYLCTVRFGPNSTDNETLNHIDLPFGPYRKRNRDRHHQFYAGKLQSIDSDQDNDIDNNGNTTKSTTKQGKSQEQIQKELKAIEIEMKLLEAELA